MKTCRYCGGLKSQGQGRQVCDDCKISRVCSFPKCDKPIQAKLLCTGHHRQQWKGRVLVPLRPIGVLVHGTHSGYFVYGCRCSICVDASTERSRVYREQNNASIAAYMSQHMRGIRSARKELINVLKVESGCVDCGYSSIPEVLEFDHINPEEKRFTIAYAVGQRMSWNRILEEIAKCEVRCANCHRIRTAQQQANESTVYSQLILDRYKITNDIKTKNGCVDCGYAVCALALQFDHIDPKTKFKEVSALIWGRYSWQRIVDEIKKCEIRCVNCHRIKSVQQLRSGAFND